MKRQPKIEFYQDKHGLWRWQTVAINGRITGASTEGYVRLADCERGAGLTAQAILSRVTVPNLTTIH